MMSNEKEARLFQGENGNFLFDSKITDHGSSCLTFSRSCRGQNGEQSVRQEIVFRGNFKDLFQSIQMARTFLNEN